MSSFTMILPLELKVLVSTGIKNWVKENHIELVNLNVFKNK